MKTIINNSALTPIPGVSLTLDDLQISFLVKIINITKWEYAYQKQVDLQEIFQDQKQFEDLMNMVTARVLWVTAIPMAGVLNPTDRRRGIDILLIMRLYQDAKNLGELMDWAEE